MTGLKHNPFSSLRSAVAASTPKPVPASPASKAPLGRIVVREEFDAAEKSMITRVMGVPREHLGVLGKQWRETLGQTVAIEGRDLLVMAAECERIATLLRHAGASDVVIVRPANPADDAPAGEPGGTQRAQIRRGMRVAIVMKADQETGALTEGIVSELLTSSSTHPRGIKVRLESGEVGRVRRILSR